MFSPSSAKLDQTRPGQFSVPLPYQVRGSRSGRKYHRPCSGKIISNSGSRTSGGQQKDTKISWFFFLTPKQKLFNKTPSMRTQRTQKVHHFFLTIHGWLDHALKRSSPLPNPNSRSVSSSSYARSVEHLVGNIAPTEAGQGESW